MGRADREIRESRARQTVARAIPELLRSSIKAKHGVLHSELIDDPQPVVKTSHSATAAVHPGHLKVRIDSRGALGLARSISERYFANAATRKSGEGRPNVAVHNMGSMTVRGGGFMRGVGGQEEYLCARTTLYESLHDDFYMLPVKGGIYSPDILVFRDEHGDDYSKKQRFFIDVITAGTFKHPQAHRSEDVEGSCSCGVSYCDDHRSIMMQKMKAVLRIAQMKGTKRLILGAWGVGQNHPVEEVAKLWRKVISGAQRQKRPNAEQWEGLEEITFALVDSSQRRAFEKHWHDVMTDEPLERVDSVTALEDEIYQQTPDANLVASAQTIELRMEEASNAFSKAALKQQLRALNRQIATSRAARAYKDDAGAEETEEVVEGDFVVAGYPASDGEENTYYGLADTTDSASDTEDARSEVYEFRFGGPGTSGSTADEDEEFDGHVWVGCAHSPRFDPQTGWFQGSIDQLHMLNNGGRLKEDSISPRSPLVREVSQEIKEPISAVEGLLERFRRTDVVDQSE